jgi:hypothetical protein
MAAQIKRHKLKAQIVCMLASEPGNGAAAFSYTESGLR